MVKKPEDKKAGPLDVLLIGCGRASRDHVRALTYLEKRGRMRLAGLVDRDLEAAKAIRASRKASLHQPLIDQDLDQILARHPFQLAVIATPPRTHASLAHKALEAGLHLVVEKPLTLDAREARALVDRAKADDRILVTGFKWRYIPGVKGIQDLIAQGLLGPPLYGTVTTRWGHDQAYYDQADWFGTWAAEGGALMNQSIHALDLMAWLMGARPLEATAVIARQCHDMEAADFVTGTLTLEGNRYLLLEGTTNTHPDHHEASFFLRCEKGTVRASFAGGKQTLSVTGDDGRQYGRRLILGAVKEAIKKEGWGLVRHLGNPYTFLYLDLLEAIREGRPPLAPGQAGLDSLLQALALLKAAKEGRTVAYPPLDFDINDMAGFFD